MTQNYRIIREDLKILDGIFLKQNPTIDNNLHRPVIRHRAWKFEADPQVVAIHDEPKAKWDRFERNLLILVRYHLQKRGNVDVLEILDLFMRFSHNLVCLHENARDLSICQTNRCRQVFVTSYDIFPSIVHPANIQVRLESTFVQDD